MIPPSVRELLYHHQDDPPDTFRFKDPKNHPFMSNIKLEFASTDGGSVAKTYFHWIEEPSVRQEVRRIRNCYDEHGKCHCSPFAFDKLSLLVAVAFCICKTKLSYYILFYIVSAFLCSGFPLRERGESQKNVILKPTHVRNGKVYKVPKLNWHR